MERTATLYLCGRVAGRELAWALDRPVLDIGRSAKNAIHIPDPTISKEHATIEWTAEGCVLRDLGSRNGTRVNGIPVTEPTVLAPDDDVAIGHVMFRIIEESGVPPGVKSPAAANSSMMIPAQEILRRAAVEHDPLRVVGALTAAGKLLVRPRSIREIGEAFLSIVVQTVPASRLVLMLRSESGGEPRIMASRPASPTPPVLSRAIQEAVLHDGASVLAVDAGSDERFQGHASILAHEVHSVIAVPLLDGDKVLGLLYADSSDPEVVYEQRHLEVMTLLANMAAVKIANGRLLEAEEQHAQMIQELATARRIQRGILPAAPPSPGGWDCSAFLDTCHEVGGDLYDLWRSPSGALYLMVGDVSGKGMGAALLMTSVVASARMLYDDDPEPGDLACRLNRTLFRSTDASLFVTAFIGRLDPETGRLAYVNAGHPRPFVREGGGAVSELGGSGLPLGITERATYPTRTTDLDRGSLLLVYTDGIPEASGVEGFFGSGRLERRVREAASVRCETVARSILGDLDAFVGPDRPREDDVTLVLLRREAAGAGACP